MNNVTKFALATMIALPISSANAELFSITLEQSGNTNTVAFDSAEDMFNRYENGELDSILSGYNDSDAAVGKLDFRGIQMQLDYSASGQLTFYAPGITDTALIFDKGSQTASFDAFKDYLEKNQDNLLKDILRAGVANTPYDAIAGNPNSLLAQMTENSFNPIMKNVVFAPNISLHEVEKDGKTTETMTLSVPIGMIHEISDNGTALIWDVPLAYSDVDGAAQYSAQVGVAVKFNIIKGEAEDFLNEWSIAPGIRAGVAGSIDMISGGVLYSGTISNLLRFKTSEKTTLSMTNMVGRFSDYTLDIDGYDIDYGINSNAFRNGLDFEYQFSSISSARVFVTNTTFTGTDLYIDSYNEAGFAIGWKPEDKEAFFQQISAFANYGWGDNYQSFRLGLELNF